MIFCIHNKLEHCIFFAYTFTWSVKQQLNPNKNMKSTINNAPSEIPNSQSLHAGFDLLIKPEGIDLTESYLYNNMIFFILDGSVKIYSPHTQTKSIGEPHMLFLKGHEKYTYEITPCSQILAFTFDSLTIDELFCFRAQHDLLPESSFEWIELKIIEPLYSFLKLLIQYLEKNYLNYNLYLAKREELFYLLKTVYPSKDLGHFFYLLANHPSEFEKQVAENYMKVKNVKELANLMGYGINSFRVKFKENFGIPAYQWLLNEKAKRILKCLTTKGEDFKSIIDDFDFSSHSHFYKFCKTQFGLTPEELKKKLNS